MDGWIMLHRKITEHWIWNDPAKLKWWIDILLTVNHADEKVNIGMQLIDCKRGQSVKSLQTWAKRWGVSKGTARRFLDMLKDDAMIGIESVSVSTRITVCNYEDYQHNPHASETHLKRKRNASETQAYPNNNDNNGNNDNNKNKGDFDLVVSDWFAYKKEKKQSYKSDRAKNSFIQSLKKLSGGSHEIARQIIEQSMANNWAGIFELKNSTNGRKKQQSGTTDEELLANIKAGIKRGVEENAI